MSASALNADTLRFLSWRCVPHRRFTGRVSQLQGGRSTLIAWCAPTHQPFDPPPTNPPYSLHAAAHSSRTSFIPLSPCARSCPLLESDTQKARLSDELTARRQLILMLARSVDTQAQQCDALVEALRQVAHSHPLPHSTPHPATFSLSPYPRRGTLCVRTDGLHRPVSSLTVARILFQPRHNVTTRTRWSRCPQPLPPQKHERRPNWSHFLVAPHVAMVRRSGATSRPAWLARRSSIFMRRHAQL